MDKKEISDFFDEAKENLGFYIKEEAKRWFVGETYPYLIKIPNVVFAVVSLVATFTIFTLELILAGIFLREEPITYGDLLLGFILALLIGLIIGRFFSSKTARKIHDQIGEALKYKMYHKED